MGHDVTVYCRTYFSPAQAAHHGMRLVRLPTIRSKHLETLVHTFLSTIHALFSDSDIVHYQRLGPALFPSCPAGSERRRWSRSRDWTGSGESGAGLRPPFCNWVSGPPSNFPT